MLDALPHCRVGRFGSKGFALMVRYQAEGIPNIYPQDETCKQPIVEFKGSGANITVPPSLHAKTGKPYVWLDPETGDVIEALPPIEELPILTPADAKRVCEALAPYSRAPRQHFTPQFKLFIAGNHKPSLRTVDEAWRRRMHRFRSRLRFRLSGAT